MKPEIFKVQIPLETNLETPLVYAYNKDKTIERFFPVDEFIIAWMDGKPKKYFWGTIDLQTRKLGFIGEAPWQSW